MAKTILITGCSTGIGYECAKTLQKRGYEVFATCRKDEDVKKLISEGLNAHKLDVCDTNSINEALAWMLKATNGRIDVLFNNAGYAQPASVEDLSRELLMEQFDTNVFGPQVLTNLVLPHMRKQKNGLIVYNSSILGFFAMSYRGAYNSSKFAIEGLVDTLRLELKGSGVNVVLLQPGPIRSDFRKNALAKFLANIDRENSAHKEVYEKTLGRLEGSKDAPFTLDADAVCDALIDAIESKIPKIRYAITFPTKLFALLKRLLPTSILDRIAIKAGD